MSHLIEVKKIGPRPDGLDYEIRFNTDPRNARHFNRFTEALGVIRDKRYDLSSDAWVVGEGGLSYFHDLERRIYPPQKTMREKMEGLISVEKKEVEGWQSIGASMKLQPYDYQKQAVKFILDAHGDGSAHDTLIVSPCGSGKSPMMIAAYLECLDKGIVQGPGMIVVKASLKVQWEKEVQKFSDLRPRVIRTYKDLVGRDDASLSKKERKLEELDGTEKRELEKEIRALKKEIKEKFAAQFDDADLFILNYETLNDENVRKALLKIAPQFIASDESQYIKSDSTKRAKALYKFNEARVKIGATATPVQRDPRDIFGIFKFVHPELFPKKTDFSALYVRYGYGYRVIGAKNEKKLNEKISPYMFILTKEEVSKHLPSLVVQQRYCRFSAKQQAVNDRFFDELEELHEKEKSLSYGLSEAEIKVHPEILDLESAIASRQTFLQELTLSERLLKESDSRLASQFVTGSPDEKIALMKDLVAEIIDSGEKVCIFSRFAKMQPIIAEAIHSIPELRHVGIAYIRGEFSPERRYEEAYTKFRDDDNYKILICSDAGAEGLNLSLCKHMIEMDLALSYAVQTQRHGRLERADSVHDTVYVTQLIMENSWDEIAKKVIDKKEKFDISIVKGVN